MRLRAFLLSWWFDALVVVVALVLHAPRIEVFRDGHGT